MQPPKPPFKMRKMRRLIQVCILHPVLTLIKKIPHIHDIQIKIKADNVI